MTLIPVKLVTKYLFALSFFLYCKFSGNTSIKRAEGKQYTKLAQPVKNASPVVEFFRSITPHVVVFIVLIRLVKK